MSNTHFLNKAATLSLAVGIMLTIKGNIALLGDLTGQGSLIQSSPQTALMQPREELHSAAPFAVAASQTFTAQQITIGILLILLGFLLHAMTMTRNNERKVHITVKPKQNTASNIPQAFQKQQWFWVEMRL